MILGLSKKHEISTLDRGSEASDFHIDEEQNPARRDRSSEVIKTSLRLTKDSRSSQQTAHGRRRRQLKMLPDSERAHNRNIGPEREREREREQKPKISRGWMPEKNP